MSNLYKAHVNQNKGDFYTRVIDYNDLLEQKLSALSFEQEAKLRRERMEQSQNETEGGEPMSEQAQDAQFQEGLLHPQLATAPELEIDYVEQAKEQAAQIVAKATADAEAILTKAAQEAEKLKEDTKARAQEQGYAEGMERAAKEEEQMREELEKQRLRQEHSYEKQLAQMEPILMETVIDVFDHVLQTDFSKRKDILLHLIRRTVQNIKNSQTFRIRVSAQDYPQVSARKEEIIQKIGSEVSLDLVMDDSMEQGQCIIDTDEGIFDCGLDVQLLNLTKDLKALSCMDHA